jgi:paraquat-inducible protein B
VRYLWHAFFARPDIPLLRLPWNAMGVVAASIAGFVLNDPNIWAVTAAGEFIYLFTMASNGGFQRSIDEQRVVEARGDTDEARHALKKELGGAARRRYEKLEEKRQRLEKLYRETNSDDLFIDANLDALKRLTWLFLNLLIAQRNLIVAPKTDERELQKQIAQCERELAAAPSQTARTSIDATLRLLRERLDNIQHRDTSMAEVEADLARIETQFDLAIEEATLRGQPAAISANVELTSHLLGNLDDSSTYSSSSTRTYE